MSVLSVARSGSLLRLPLFGFLFRIQLGLYFSMWHGNQLTHQIAKRLIFIGFFHDYRLNF
jgi:hypothetical protein